MLKNKIIIKKKFDHDLKLEWNNLENQSNVSFFQTFEWQRFWFDICGNDLEILIVLFYKNDVLVSILPFKHKEKFFFNILNWNGFPFSDYNQPIVKDNYSLELDDFNYIKSKINQFYKFDNIHLINNINSSFLEIIKIIIIYLTS